MFKHHDFKLVLGAFFRQLLVFFALSSSVLHADTQTHKVKLVFSKDTIFRDTGSTYTAWDTSSMTVNACHLRFAGYWFSWDTHWRLHNGAKITVDSAARLNNNESNLIFARTFWVEGSGIGRNVIEFDAGFKADHMNYNPSDLRSWTNCGLSLIQFDRIEVITNASQNLATVYKKCWNDTVSHHGLWLFGKDTTNAHGDTWIVRSNDQEYDGGICWLNPLTLVTEKNLTIKGMNNRCVSINFGSCNKRAAVLIKKGSGALIINGTQGYNKGSRFFIEEGMVSFGTDPGDTAAFAYGLTSDYGQFLAIDVAAGGSVHFLNGAIPFDWDLQKYYPVVVRNGIFSLNSSGAVLIGNGIVDVAANFVLQSNAELRFQKAGSGIFIKVGGTATCAGKLVVDTLPEQAGDYTLITAQSVSGAFSATSFPPSRDVNVLYQNNKVILRVSVSAVAGGIGARTFIRAHPRRYSAQRFTFAVPNNGGDRAIHAQLVTMGGIVAAVSREARQCPLYTEIIFENMRSTTPFGLHLIRCVFASGRETAFSVLLTQ